MKKSLHLEAIEPEALRRRLAAEPLPDNMCALLDARAAEHPDRRAWLFFERDEDLTYLEVLENVGRAANALSALGVRKGSHVAVMSLNCSAYLIAWLAIARLGAVIVPINTRYTPREVKYVLDDGDIDYMIIWHELTAALDGIDQWPPRLRDERVIVIGATPAEGRHRWETILESASTTFEPRECVGLDDIVNIQYTSGTSGFPKGCMLTHRYWLTIGRTMSGALGFPLTRALYNQNFFYMDGPAIAMMCFERGAAFYLVTRPSIAKFVDWIRAFAIEYCFFFEALYKHPETPLDADNELKLIQTFGFNPKNHADLERRYGTTARESYGMTECGCALYMPIQQAEMVGSGSCGIAAPYREVMIMDEEGEPAGRGVVGELLVRGPGIMLGYYKRPEANAESFVDGWFRTGDLFRQDEDGFFYIVGRKKDMIRRNAENIAAREVEEVLRGYADIEEVAAVPVPDERVGEEVKVYVKLREGRTKQTVTPQQILEYCDGRLASFKIPRYVGYCAEFPKTDSDRVEKKKLIAGVSDLRLDSYDRVDGIWR
jgi:crotonobetaine/carnitine-CoA ligase